MTWDLFQQIDRGITLFFFVTEMRKVGKNVFSVSASRICLCKVIMQVSNLTDIMLSILKGKCFGSQR